jgi:hypothetical protein
MIGLLGNIYHMFPRNSTETIHINYILIQQKAPTIIKEHWPILEDESFKEVSEGTHDI